MIEFKESKLKLKALPAAFITAVALMAAGSPAHAAPDDNQEPSTSARLTEMKGQIQSINEELSGQRATLGALKTEIYAQREETDDYRRSLLSEMKALRRQNQSLVDSIYDNRVLASKNEMTEVKPLRNYDLQTPDGKMYFGEDEYVYVKEADATFDARIDTGAAVSSISAQDITEFERNGKRWYRFTVEANDHKIQVEAPYVRTSTIRQVSKHTTTERIVVALNVKVGDYSTTSEFTLSDRTRLQYPLLIGRTLMQDIAVVDVARDHIQGRNKDTFLILSREDYEKAMKAGKDPNAAYKQKQEAAAAVGQIARPSGEYGSNLGSNSENALPAVRNKSVSDDKDKAASGPVKATPKSAAGQITEPVKDDKAAKPAKNEKSAKDEKAAKPAQDDKSAKDEKAAKPAKDEKAAKDEKSTKPAKDEKADKPAKDEKSAKDDKAATSEKADKSKADNKDGKDKAEKSEKTDKSEKSATADSKDDKAESDKEAK